MGSNKSQNKQKIIIQNIKTQLLKMKIIKIRTKL